MKLKHIKLFTVIFFSLTTLFACICAEAQTRQTKQSPTQAIDENKEAMREIEAMREMIRERREQQDRQKRMLQELQQAAGIETPLSSVQQTKNEELEPSYQPPVQKSKQERARGGNILSEIEAEEDQDIAMLQQKYNIEMQIAQKEIEMLKKQLAIANKQLGQCQASNLSIDKNSYNDNIPAFSEPVKRKEKQQKASKHTTNTETAVQSQVTSENKQAMQEIEMMREMIRKRREQQDQQRKMLQDLQQALD